MAFTPLSPTFRKLMSSEVARVLAADFPPARKFWGVTEPLTALEWDCPSVGAAIALNDQIEARLEEITARP